MSVVPLASNASPFISLRHRVSRILPASVLQLAKKQYYAHFVKNLPENADPDLIVVKQLLMPGDFAVDVGANVGIYTKFLSRWVGTAGRVYSIEPIAATFEILRSNIRRLSLDNVFVVNCAVSETSGSATMEIPVWSSGAENFCRAEIVADDSQDSLRHVKVKVDTLDSLLGAASKPVSFIKLDVEGHELQCLRGATATIGKSRPAWLVEIWGDPQEESDVAHAIFELMKTHGYQPFWFDGKILIKYRAGHRSMNFWFLMPEHVQRLLARGVVVDQ